MGRNGSRRSILPIRIVAGLLLTPDIDLLSTHRKLAEDAASLPLVAANSKQVKSKNKEVQLHRDSPLGDTVLECYASGTRNLFVLGFVPVKSENTVVLLARDTPPNHPTIRDLNLDLSQVR